jgi:hypothetical protein
MEKNLARASVFVAIVLLSIVSPAAGIAQGNNKPQDNEATKVTRYTITSVRLNDFNSPNHYLIVDLSDPQDPSFARGFPESTPDSRLKSFAESDLRASNITIKFLPSGKVIPAEAINNNQEDARANTRSMAASGAPLTLQIGLGDGDETRPLPGDDQVEVTFGVLHFTGLALPKSGLSGRGKVYNRLNISQLVEETRQALKDAVAHAKTDEERDVFVGLNVTVPSGEGSTEGSGDININRNLYASSLGQAAFFDRANFGLHLKKASEERADARHFDLGLTFTKTFLLADKSKLSRIKQALATAGTPVNVDGIGSVLQDIADLQKNFVRAILFDSALRFEGDVSSRGISNVSNLLYDGQLQVATVSRAFAGRTGFWNFRLVGGAEVGSNLNNNDNPSEEGGALARVKGGGELYLIFKAPNPNEPLSRVEFSAKALERYLFKNENVLDPLTNMAVLIDKGGKYWLQADLKVISGFRTARGRVGFRISFTRGYLPPVYNFVKSFNFGVVFETNDDDNSGTIKLQ